MSRVETFRNCTLYLGDAREIVPVLDRKARLAVTDAPYALTAGGVRRAGSRHRTMSGGWMAGYDNSGKVCRCDITWDDIFAVLAEALLPDAEAYVMANDKNVIPAGVAALAQGFKPHNLLVWDKISATPNRWYMKNCEFTLFLYRGRARAIANCSTKQLARLPQRDESDHPTEKPVPLMEVYIANSARRGELVIDPFMGSGTTGLAALRTGNPFVGVEIEAAHFDTACRRMERACTDPQIDLEVLLRGTSQTQGA